LITLEVALLLVLILVTVVDYIAYRQIKDHLERLTTIVLWQAMFLDNKFEDYGPDD
jgi:hypothetical protein